eukprot:417654-Amphidinium_carterae.1
MPQVPDSATPDKRSHHVLPSRLHLSVRCSRRAQSTMQPRSLSSQRPTRSAEGHSSPLHDSATFRASKCQQPKNIQRVASVNAHQTRNIKV